MTRVVRTARLIMVGDYYPAAQRPQKPRWDLQRWDIHRIRRGLRRAIEAEEALMGIVGNAPRHGKAHRDVALWRELDGRLELMLQRDHEQRHGTAETPEDPDDLIG